MKIVSIFGNRIDLPPSDDECDSVAANAEARRACSRLQDPGVWNSESDHGSSDAGSRR